MLMYGYVAKWKSRFVGWVEVRADGVGGFVDARECKCTAGYGADVAMGDEPRSKWGGKARFYAVTSVRAAD